MILPNKKGLAKIICNKNSNVIKAGFSPTKLTANFNYLSNNKNQDNKITPVWFVECDNIECYGIEESDNGKCISISTTHENCTGEIVKVTLIDKEQNYVSDSIELEVISL